MAHCQQHRTTWTIISMHLDIWTTYQCLSVRKQDRVSVGWGQVSVCFTKYMFIPALCLCCISMAGHSLEGPIIITRITHLLCVLSVDLCLCIISSPRKQPCEHQITIVLIFINDETEVEEMKELVPCHYTSNVSSYTQDTWGCGADSQTFFGTCAIYYT